jgi:hypothetical protein
MAAPPTANSQRNSQNQIDQCVLWQRVTEFFARKAHLQPTTVWSLLQLSKTWNLYYHRAVLRCKKRILYLQTNQTETSVRQEIR